jgi:uncharacterized RDD family membrane protein YckC
MYQVIDQTGQAFGPVALETLRQWAAENRLTPEMTLVDHATGQQGNAGEMLATLGVFGAHAPGPIAPPAPTATPGAYTRPVEQPQPINVQPVSYAYQGSSESGAPPMLQTRAVAFFIDFLLGMALYSVSTFLPALLLVRFDTSAWGIWNYIGYVWIPILMIYFLVRDCLFPAQSIGKRIARLKVVSTTGAQVGAVQSVTRNIAALPLFLLPIPYIGPYVALPILILLFIGECFMVMTQGRRFGDTLAHTVVVNE